MLSDNFELIEFLALKNKSVRGITECLPDSEGGDLDDGDLDEDLICEILYGISLGGFNKLIEDLLPLCMMASSPLTGITYQGFADTDRRMFLVKKRLEEPK